MKTLGTISAGLVGMVWLLVSCEPLDEYPQGAKESRTLKVTCLDMVIDEDPLMAHTPAAYDDEGNVVHACELYFSEEIKNGQRVLDVATMRFFLQGHWWSVTGGHFGSSTGFVSGSFDFWLQREGCADCTAELSGPYSYCDLRNGRGCAFELCQERLEVGVCAKQWASGLSKRLDIEFIPDPSTAPETYEGHDLRLLAQGEPTACRVLRSRSSGALQLEFQLGTWNRLDVTKLFGVTCAAEQGVLNHFTYRMGGVAGPGTWGPVSSVQRRKGGGDSLVRLPEIVWPIPLSFLGMRVPAPSECGDHGSLQLDDDSVCTLVLEEDRVDLTCERAMLLPPQSPIIPERYAPYWGFDRLPPIQGRFRVAGDCDLREVP